MSRTASGRPETSEYASAYEGYIGKVEGTDIVPVLEQQLESITALIRGLDESIGDFRYGPEKWTVKQLLGHIIDSERVFAYRALVFARNDGTALPGFDQEPWAQHANYANLPLKDIAAEFEAVRRSSLFLFKHLDASAWDRKGIGNGKNMTTRSAAFVIGGHAQHHLDILKARYLGK